MNDYLRRAADTALPQLVDISKLGLNSKIKKFSYSFICGKGYSPPLRGGRIAFCLQSAAGGGYRLAEVYAEQQRMAFDLHMEISFVNTVQFAAKKMPAEGLRIQ